jgi:hypothetical protein
MPPEQGGATAGNEGKAIVELRPRSSRKSSGGDFRVLVFRHGDSRKAGGDRVRVRFAYPACAYVYVVVAFIVALRPVMFAIMRCVGWRALPRLCHVRGVWK